MHVQDRKVATKAEKDTTPARYAVMGNPVAHSKSPAIHKQFAHQFGHNIEYTALWVDSDGFADAVEQFRTEGGKGFNITVPFKLEAFRLTDNLSDRAKLAGAVNTIRFEPDGKIFGDNTDGTGLVHDLTKNLGVHLKDKTSDGENVFLGTGLVNFKKVFQALNSINYDGPYVFETVRGSDPVNTARFNVRFAKFFIGEAQSDGVQ